MTQTTLKIIGQVLFKKEFLRPGKGKRSNFPPYCCFTPQIPATGGTVEGQS